MAAKASPKSSRKEPVAPRREAASKRKLAVAAPSAPIPVQLPLEERVRILEERLERVAKTDPEFRRAYRESLDMSWIYHDSALEGTVYTSHELKGAVDPGAPLVTDSTIQPICEEIRRHREALDFIRDYAVNKKRQPVTVDVVKKIYLILHPEEGDIKTVKYRKDIPQHRLYFHEYAPPDKITYKVRQVIDWVNDPETRRTRSPVRIAARAHYDLLRVFPFPTDSGKVARLFMNLLLLRSGFPPAIVHSTERQRYYEALKGSSATMTQIVHESIENNLGSVEKLLDAHESKGYSVRV
jgi:Fic family protein